MKKWMLGVVAAVSCLSSSLAMAGDDWHVFRAGCKRSNTDPSIYGYFHSTKSAAETTFRFELNTALAAEGYGDHNCLFGDSFTNDPDINWSFSSESEARAAMNRMYREDIKYHQDDMRYREENIPTSKASFTIGRIYLR